MTGNNIRWTAELTHVDEVSLLGTASLSYWRDKLAREELRPIETNGRAQLLIIAAEASFMRLRFMELSVSVLVSSDLLKADKRQAFLVHAFNSRRTFVFCERKLFATPYTFADVRLSSDLPAWVEVADRNTVFFRIAMSDTLASTGKREPTHCADDGWQGPVFLPSSQRCAADARRLFFARVSGFAKTYPFRQEDEYTIRPGQGRPMLESLIASEFIPTEWVIRSDAQHAKSKTYRRSDWSSVGPT